MKIHEFIGYINEIVPLAYVEDFDNVGLLVGNSQSALNGVLVSLDATEDVVEEAISEGCNLILAFHPILFKGIKSITPTNYVNRALIKALKNDIAIFVLHTALDNHIHGVNDMICNKLGLLHTKILIPKKGTIKKLTAYVPRDKAEYVRDKLFEAGAGSIGNYTNCSFKVEGQGSYKGNEESNPVYGEKGILHFEKETQLNITFSAHLESKIVETLHVNHPYEEVAYEIETLDNTNQNIGMGKIGEFEKEMTETEFLKHLKMTFKIPVIRHSKVLNKSIRRVAVLGGSGAFAIHQAIQHSADAFVSADFKYHDFFKAEQKILLADVGHFESEQYTKDLLYSIVNEKFTNFAIILSKTKTNPVHYY